MQLLFYRIDDYYTVACLRIRVALDEPQEQKEGMDDVQAAVSQE